LGSGSLIIKVVKSSVINEHMHEVILFMQGGKRQNAGRPRGSRNKRTLAVIDRLGDWHPLEALVDIAKDESQPIETRIDCCKIILPYCSAKISNVEAVAFERRNELISICG